MEKEFNKQKIIERMMDKDYVKAYREYSCLIEKIETFLSKNEQYVEDLLAAQAAYFKNEIDHAAQLRFLQTEKTEESRENISKKLKSYLVKIKGQKDFIKTLKEEYQEKFSFDELETRLIDL